MREATTGELVKVVRSVNRVQHQIVQVQYVKMDHEKGERVLQERVVFDGEEHLTKAQEELQKAKELAFKAIAKKLRQCSENEMTDFLHRVL